MNVIQFPPKKTEKMMDDYIKDIIRFVIPDEDLRTYYLAMYLEELRTLSFDQWSIKLDGLDLPEDKRLRLEAVISEEYSRRKMLLMGRIMSLQIEICKLQQEH
jgi:hypothetical protein